MWILLTKIRVVTKKKKKIRNIDFKIEFIKYFNQTIIKRIKLACDEFALLRLGYNKNIVVDCLTLGVKVVPLDITEFAV